MLVQQQKLDVLANNLANTTTTGFKRILTAFESTKAAEPSQRPAAPTRRPSLSDSGLLRSAMRLSAEVRGPSLRVHGGLDLSQGPLEETGNPLDIAISGDGFFAVRSEEGELFTRGGAFRLDAEGNLSTLNGAIVLGVAGPIQLSPGAVQVADDGSISVEGELVDRIRIVRFDDASRLQHAGGNLLRAPTGLNAAEAAPGEIAVAQGYLEGSNSDPIQELVALITAQRVYEANQRVLVTADESLGRSVNEIGRVR
jgi:flagellar basal-body rod protein FlgG